jgi:ubiquinone/menaquinone biosynthesis C-methylase UbiE
MKKNKRKYPSFDDTMKRIIAKGCRGKIVLDNGCGNLPYTILALKSGAREVHALDIVETEKTKSLIPKLRNSRYTSRFNFYREDAQDLPFDNKTVDVILCIGLIEYVNMDKCMTEMLRVLTDRGYIIFQTKDSRGWRHRWYKFKCMLFGRKIIGRPQKYKVLMKKLNEHFNVNYYKETKPRHNFLAVLRKK